MKRSVIFLLAALLAASLVVPAMAEEPVTLRFWTDPRFRNIAGMEDKTSLPGEWEMIQAQEFMKLYPHVTIEVEVIPFEDLTVRVPAAIAAGGAPDILKDYLGRTAQYWHEGVLEPLEDLIPQDELADYLPSLVEMYTLDGHLHALPSYSWVGHLVANKAIWDEKGLGHLLPTIDNPSWTVEEFEAAIGRPLRKILSGRLACLCPLMAKLITAISPSSGYSVPSFTKVGTTAELT